MRRAIQLLLVSMVFLGCATTDQPQASSSTNLPRIQALYDAFGRGDMPTVLGGFDPNIVWTVAESLPYADRNPYRGPQAIVEGVFMRLGQEWNGFRVNVEQMIDGGDTVVAIGRYTATHKSTGQPLDAQFVHVWSFRNGKVVRLQQFADSARFARATGAWK